MKPTTEETDLWIALNRAHRRIHLDMEARLHANGLPPLRWYDILWSIEKAGQDGVKAFELKNSLLFDQSNLSRILAKMEQQVLIEQKAWQQDRRAKILTITEAGRQLRYKMWGVYGNAIHMHMRDLLDDPGNSDLIGILHARY